MSKIEKGKFYVLDGVGAAGKTTQAPLACEYLRSLGREVVLTREPGGVAPAETIRELIFLLKGKDAINPDHQVALFFAARYFWKKGVVVPNLYKGIDVLTDRYASATKAYRGYAEGADTDAIDKMVDAIMGEDKPDGIILLDVNARTAIERNQKDKTKRGEDPFDTQELEYFEKVIQGYREMAEENWDNIPWYFVDGEQSIDKVAEDVRVALDLIIGR